VRVADRHRFGSGGAPSVVPEDYELMNSPYHNAAAMERMHFNGRSSPPATTSSSARAIYDIPKTNMTPAPTPPIPILVGGHADVALGAGASGRLDALAAVAIPRNRRASSTASRGFGEEEGKTWPVREFM